MKPRTTLMLIFALSLAFKSYAQKQDYPRDMHFKYANSPKFNFPEELEKLNKIDLKNIKDKQHWIYYLHKSSLHLYTGRDSALAYFNKAYKLAPRGICRIMRGINEGVKWRIEKDDLPDNYTWYIYELPNFDEKTFLDECKVLFPPKLKPKRKKEDSTLLGRTIRRNDQIYRIKRPVDWGKQDPLDQRNKAIMDSVFLERGALSKFNSFELHQFGLVIHHSNKNSWTMKWIDIVFRAMESGEISGINLIGPAMERFFHPKTGGIVKQEPLKARAFMDKLKKDYPKTVKYLKLEDY